VPLRTKTEALRDPSFAVPGPERRPGQDIDPGSARLQQETRELANFVDALHDHRARRTKRSGMRVHFWERRARDASAVGAVA
jgi:hypothetical protein